MFQHEGHQSSTWLVLVRSCEFNLLILRHTKYWHVSSLHYLFPISNMFKSALLMGFLSESQNFRVYFLPTFSKRSRRTYIGATISIYKIYTSKLTISGLPFTFGETIRTWKIAGVLFVVGHCKPQPNGKNLIRESSSPTHQLSYTLRSNNKSLTATGWISSWCQREPWLVWGLLRIEQFAQKTRTTSGWAAKLSCSKWHHSLTSLILVPLLPSRWNDSGHLSGWGFICTRLSRTLCPWSKALSRWWKPWYDFDLLEVGDSREMPSTSVAEITGPKMCSHGEP